MAVANTYTWLPLATWAKIMGYNPWLFAGFSQFLGTIGSECHDVWFQDPGQSDNLSREELAYAIRDAELQIAEFVGYNLLPEWGQDLVTPPRFHRSELNSDLTTRNRAKSVKVKTNYLIQLGVQTKTLLENVAVVPVDLDGDGFNETARITTAHTDLDTNQIRLYYPGESGADEWEIRPVQAKGGGIFEFPMYLIPDPALVFAPVVDPIDPNQATSYIDTVDVYQVYNDTTAPVTLVYDTSDCSDCNESSTTSCAVIEDHKYGYVKYNPTFIVSNCRYEPDKIRINYLAGWQGSRGRTLLDLDNYWQTTIAYLTPTFFSKPPTGCCGNEDSDRVTKWQLDFRSIEGKGAFVTGFLLENPFGAFTHGAWYAYNRTKNKRV